MNRGPVMEIHRLTDFIYAKASRERIPISGTFELTPVCNFSCRMCYVRKTDKQVRECNRHMRSLDEWLEIAKHASEKGMLYLLLTGGEPTLWPDFWILYEELIRMGFLVSINTNGTGLEEDSIQRLVKNPPRRINITLYGANDDTYYKLCGVKDAFSIVDRAITRLTEKNIQVKLNCSLTPYNVCDLEKMVNYAKERNLILDITSYMFPPLRRNESMIGRNDRFSPEEAARYRLEAYRFLYGEDRYQAYIREIIKGSVNPPGLDEGCVDPLDGKIRCRAGKASFWITWDGWMSPCGMMTKPQIDLDGNSFDEAWNMLVSECEKIRLSGVCAECCDRDLCHACAAMAQTETGEIGGIPKYLCELVREMKRLAIDFTDT